MVVPEGELADGLIVTTDLRVEGRVLFDSSLQIVALDPSASPELYVDFGSWPDRAWQPGFNVGDGVAVLDTTNNKMTMFADVGLVNRSSHQAGTGVNGPHRFVGVADDEQTFLIDLEQLDMSAPGGQLRYGGPAVSPDQRWVISDTDHDDNGPSELTVSSTLSPTESSWTYEAIEGTVFVDTGRFDPDGEVTVQLRTVGSGPLELFTYHGLPGRDLQLIEEPARADWERRLGDLEFSIDDDVASVLTNDGVRTEINEDRYLGCDGTAVAVLLLEDRVRFIERDGSATTDVLLSVPGSVETSTLPVQHLRVGSFELHYVLISPGAPVLVVDCERRVVHEFTAALEEVGGEPGLAVDGAASLTNSAAVVTLLSGDQTALLVVDSHGPRFDPLGQRDVRRAFLSPSGTKLGLAIRDPGEFVLQIRDVTDLVVETESRFPGEVDSTIFTWAPTR
ncbi:MAG: hypothetical protein GY745_02190 [Actinomycetia bacterium]|nr:hypothetical protein [Actinomycetes bacterium]